MLNRKAVIIHSIVGLIKSISLYEIYCYLPPYCKSKNKTEVELDFSNYATKSGDRLKRFDLKRLSYVIDKKFVKKGWV